MPFSENEIEAAMLKPGEDEDSCREQKILVNSGEACSGDPGGRRGALLIG
jgi:hypothetical protein